MNDFAKPLHDSVPPLDLPSTPTQPKSDFLSEWLAERALQREWGVFASVPTFVGAFKIITHDEQGAPRPDLSRTRYQRAENKYMSPPGVGVVIYVPQPDSYSRFASAKEKWIAEGEGKALALTGLGLPVLGVGGVRGWHLKGRQDLHPALAKRIKKGDVVNIAVDGDWQTNANVREGAALLMFALRGAGATPQLVQLPATADGKVGIDDQIAVWRLSGLDPLTELAKLPRLQTLRPTEEIPLTDYAAILQRPAPVWIVKNLIPPGELTAIVGETSCGKTFLTIDLLLAVARGSERWFGQTIKREGLVVHVTLEGSGLGNRLRAYQQHHKLEATALPYSAIEVPISLRADADALITSITRRRVELGLEVVLIAIDTVNRAMGGGDENSSADMGAFLAAAEKVKSAFPQSGLLLVHHVGKDSSRGARGHSSFSANVGAELQVEHDGKTGTRTVSVTKQRDGRTDMPFTFRLLPVELGKDEDGEPIASCVVEQCSAPQQDAGGDHRARYGWMHLWFVGDQNNRRAVSKRRIGENLLNIIPKGSKIRRADLEATFTWAVDKGFARLAAEQPKRGEYYDLHSLPPPKY